MRGVFKFLLVFVGLVPGLAYARNVVSRAASVTNTPTSGYTYNYMYPYLNNQMRKTLNPGDANAQSTSPINVIVKTQNMPQTTSYTPRRVVARSGRAPTNTGAGKTNYNMGGTSARSAVANNTGNSARRVSPRSVVARSATRTNNSGRSVVLNSGSGGGIYMSTGRCLSDYTECMNDYCVRADTAYNRCFCSARLSQIESQYQPQIDSLIKQILRARDTTGWTDAEMTEYWNETIGQYVGENTWAKLDDALDIDWPDAEMRMQGQNAYLTGHQYCIQHLTNCAYAAPNMRDVYRSEISRDCANYEASLDKLKTALETALSTYNN